MDTYTRGACIFIDILGTKDTQGFSEKLRIHNAFHPELSKANQISHEHTAYNRKIISFSDCAYFFYFYKDGIDEMRKNDLSLMNVAISNTSLSILKFYTEGFLVRGGACFGEFYFDELGFFGPAVEKAYRLETTKPGLPRILIEPEMGSALATKNLAEGNVHSVHEHNNNYFINEFCHLESSHILILENNPITMGSVVDKLINLTNNTLESNEQEDVRMKHAYMREVALSKAPLIKDSAIYFATEISKYFDTPTIADAEIIKLIESDIGIKLINIFGMEDIRNLVALARGNSQ